MKEESFKTKEISLAEFEGIRIGHASDEEAATGCTVLIAEEGMAAAVDIRGGGPASRESALLEPLASTEMIHAIVLSGGSAFGLEAGCGVAKFLEEKGVGFETGYAKVPLICQSCIYDLGIGRADVRPDLQMGYLACQDAYERDQRTAMGNVGAGTGATVGKAMGAERMMKSGLGSYAVQAGELKVGALVVVNALGDIYDSKTHEKIAGMRNAKGDGFEDGEQALLSGIAQQEGDNLFTANTTIGIVICNADLNKMQLKRVASASHNGYARTIRPVHTSADGDSIYAAAVGSSRINANVDMVSLLAVHAMENAVNRAVLSAKSLHGVPAAEDILQRIK